MNKKIQIGELLVQQGYVTEKQIETALRIQSKLKTKKRLGRILKELKFVTDQQLRTCLESVSGPSKIGDTLLERDFISQDQLEFILLRQAQSPEKKFGEIIIEEKLMSPANFCTALAIHKGVERVIPELRKLQMTLTDQMSLNFLKQNRVCPYRERDDRIQVLVSDSDNLAPLETIKKVLKKDVEIALVTDEELDFLFQYLQEKPKTAGARTLGQDLEEGSVASMIDDYFTQAIEMGVSDIHIEPLEAQTRIRFRKDGNLIEYDSFPKRKHNKFISRIKVMAGADITEKRVHQDGKIELSHHGHNIDLRISIFVTVQGESAVIRILNPMSNLLGLDQLGFNPKNFMRYTEEVVPSSSGIVLYTGPTGCGKTTSLYSTLQHIRNNGLKIVSVENPVEYIFPEMTQCAVDVKSGRTFSHSLKHIMRQDPDVIVLGEIRDQETAETAIHASMTGHKVYSTFHTEDSTGALIRLVQMGIEPYMVSSTVLAVVAQRLIRTICQNCRQAYVPHSKHLRRLGISPGLLKSKEFFRGKGCEKCYFTGYYGRIAVHEVLILDEYVRDAMLRSLSNFQLRELALKHSGMITMAEDAVFKVLELKTTFEEIIHKIPIPSPCRSHTQILELVR